MTLGCGSPQERRQEDEEPETDGDRLDEVDGREVECHKLEELNGKVNEMLGHTH